MADSFIETFMEYQEGSRAPEIFSRWSAISALASLAQRKVYVVSSGQELYFSKIIALVGPPGVGKTSAISPIREILTKVCPKHIAAQSMTKEAIIKMMGENPITYRLPDGSPHTYAPFLGATGELNVLLKPGDVEMLNVLNILWDCEERYVYRTKNADDILVHRPFVSILGGSTTRGLANILPKDAYASGFTARIILVYCDDKITKPPMLSVVGDEDRNNLGNRDQLRKRLLGIARRIFDLKGELVFSRAAADFLSDWYEKGCPPEPTDTRFEIYNDRRFLHTLKLCGLMSLDKSTELVIEEDHVVEAIGTLLEVEKAMPNAVVYVTENQHADTFKRLVEYIKLEAVSNGPIFPATTINKFLAQFVGPREQYELLQQLPKQGYGSLTKPLNGVQTFQLYQHHIPGWKPPKARMRKDE